MLFRHHPRARRYLLRLRQDGTVRVTIPRRGTISAAKDFAWRSKAWLEQQYQRLAAQPKTPAGWPIGTEILFRGETVRVESEADGLIRLGTERMKASDASTDLRPDIQKHLRRLAERELPKRVMKLAKRTWHPSISHFGAESEITLGIMFTAGDDLTQLAVNSDAFFCPGLHHPARAGTSKVDESFG
jgi:predicted metal-dependent hydrolase